MCGWKKIRLGDVCSMNTDSYSSRESWNFVNYLDTGNITDNIIDSIQYIDIGKDKLPSRAKRKVKENSVIVSTVRPNQRHFGIIKNQPENFLVSTGFVVIDVNDKFLDADFLYYSLSQKTIIDSLQTIAEQSTTSYPSISASDIENLEIEVPDILEQKRIAYTLRCLDLKIKQNNKVNDNLEKHLRLLYDYWFTQFDFPDENDKPYRSSGGKMVWNEQLKRKIPYNWDVTPLGEVCSFRNGINYDKNTVGDTTYRIVNVRNISSSSIILDEKELDNICLPRKQAKKYLISSNNILIARSGIPGAPRILYKPNGNIIFCGFIICASPLDSVLQHYLLLFLKLLEGSCATQTGGSILKNVSQDTLSELLVPLPPHDILTRFNQYVSPVYDLIHANLAETFNLQKLRDWLLPMLMNGQATIED